MSLAPLADGFLVLLVLGLAIWVNAARSGFVAVVSYVAFGLLLALAWMRLAAGDVALTEAAVGSGATGAVLVAAAMCLRPVETAAEPPGDPDERRPEKKLAAGVIPSSSWPGSSGPSVAARAGGDGWDEPSHDERAKPSLPLRLAALVLSGLVTAGLAALVLWTSGPAPSLADAAVRHLPGLGMGNAVTGVLIAYRALDTLLEKVVLVLALGGVWSLTRDRFWGGRPFPHVIPARNGALILLARLLPPIGIVVAVYTLWVGATDPGGAFQGGAILAAMWILVMLAGLRDAPPIGSRWLRLSVAAGPAAFLAVGLAGFALPTGFLSYPESVAKPLIIAVEAVLMLSIALILGLLVTGPAERPR